MKLLKNTLTYCTKNFSILFIFACIPACFIGGLLNPFKITSFLLNYKNISIYNFGSVLTHMFQTNWAAIINSVFAFVILIFVISAVLGLIQNNFRSGQKVYNQINSYLNNNILVVLFYLFIFLVMFYISKFIIALLFFAVHIIFSGIATTPNILTIIVNLFVCVFGIFGFSFFSSLIFIAVPETITTGYSVKTSISNANEMLNKNYLKTGLLLMLPFLIMIPLVVGGFFLKLTVIFNTLAMLISLLYYPVLCMTLYFNYSGQERKDLQKNKYFK